jgi:hypothetical protein
LALLDLPGDVVGTSGNSEKKKWNNNKSLTKTLDYKLIKTYICCNKIENNASISKTNNAVLWLL